MGAGHVTIPSFSIEKMDTVWLCHRASDMQKYDLSKEHEPDSFDLAILSFRNIFFNKTNKEKPSLRCNPG